MEPIDFLWLPAGVVAVGSLLVILYNRPTPGVWLRWAFASTVGLIAGVSCWLHLRAALREEPLKKLQEARNLVARARTAFDGNASEDMERVKRLLEEAQAGTTRAANTALLAGLLATGTVTFLLGITWQWVKGVTSKKGDGKEEGGDISAEPS